MRRRIPNIGGFLACAAAGAILMTCMKGSLAQPLRDENPPAELRMAPYSGQTPACADPSVLADIASGFVARESWYWNSPLAIVAFEGVVEAGLRNNGLSYIPRRYCRASAVFNDGLRRAVVYNIGESLGFLGGPPGVTWCVVGLDRNHAFSPDCRAAGP